MHELALIESVVEQVSMRVGDRRVARVRLRVGTLAAVLPDAMRFCFDVVTKETLLEGAALEIETVRARARCRTCDAEIELLDGIPLCPCGSVDLAILAGAELLIQDVETI